VDRPDWWKPLHRHAHRAGYRGIEVIGKRPADQHIVGVCHDGAAGVGKHDPLAVDVCHLVYQRLNAIPRTLPEIEKRELSLHSLGCERSGAFLVLCEFSLRGLVYEEENGSNSSDDYECESGH
jgi:hypothetical protein